MKLTRMQKTITLSIFILIFSLAFAGKCFGQDKKELPLSAYEKKRVADHELFVNRMQQIQKEAYKIDSSYQVFIRDFLMANKIDLSLIGKGGDSLRIDKDKISLILKKSKVKP